MDDSPSALELSPVSPAIPLPLCPWHWDHTCATAPIQSLRKGGQSTSRDSLWHGAFKLEDISTSQKDSVHLKPENLGGFLDSVLWYGRDASFLILGRLLDVQQHPSLCPPDPRATTGV